MNRDFIATLIRLPRHQLLSSLALGINDTFTSRTLQQSKGCQHSDGVLALRKSVGILFFTPFYQSLQRPRGSNDVSATSQRDVSLFPKTPQRRVRTTTPTGVPRSQETALPPGPPYGPRLSSLVGSQWLVLSYERGIPAPLDSGSSSLTCSILHPMATCFS